MENSVMRYGTLYSCCCSLRAAEQQNCDGTISICTFCLNRVSKLLLASRVTCTRDDIVFNNRDASAWLLLQQPRSSNGDTTRYGKFHNEMPHEAWLHHPFNGTSINKQNLVRES